MHVPAPGIEVVPVRTPTLPPATHTNTWVVGEGSFTVFDPASPYDDEQERLAQELEQRLAAGERLERIVLTHHHADHVAGAEDLQRRFATPDRPVPIAAHPVTADLLEGTVVVDEHLDDRAELACGDRTLQALFTPGHAPGHLVFQDVDSGATIAGDMVAGVGTILIAPTDGDLGDYLDSLERLRGIGPSVLLPAHGDPLPQADQLLAFYIAHRHQRTEQIRRALVAGGAASPEELVPEVYPDLDREAWPFAAAQILSHLRWMADHGLARRPATQGRWRP